jgi:hypothetical protein
MRLGYFTMPFVVYDMAAETGLKRDAAGNLVIGT